jgi:hypothetical protein
MTSREDERRRGQEEFFFSTIETKKISEMMTKRDQENQEMRRKSRDQKSKAKQITQGKCKGK